MLPRKRLVVLSYYTYCMVEGLQSLILIITAY